MHSYVAVRQWTEDSVERSPAVATIDEVFPSRAKGNIRPMRLSICLETIRERDPLFVHYHPIDTYWRIVEYHRRSSRNRARIA